MHLATPTTGTLTDLTTDLVVVNNKCETCAVVCEYAERVRGCRKCWCGGRGGVFAVSAGHEYVGGTRGLGIVSCAADVLGMSIVRGMRGFSGVCENACAWLKALSGLGLAFTDPVATGVVLDVCLCLGCGGVGGGGGGGSVCGGLSQCLEGCGGFMSV